MAKLLNTKRRIEPKCSAPQRLPFTYTRLDDTNNSIRVFKVLPTTLEGHIQLELKHATITGAEYSCLSYIWGEATERRTILVNGSLLDVRENLFQFLEVARRQHPNRTLWIDALCINQKDDGEKSLQVQRMGQIYSKAKETLIWLGCDAQFDVALAWVNHNRLGMPGKIPKPIADAIAQICWHPYWNRTWVTQEIIHANYNLRLIQSSHSTDLYQFCNMASKMEETSAPSVPRLSDSFPLTHHQFMLQEKSYKNNYLYGSSESSITVLWALLRWRSQSQCSDVRDRIYGLLSLIPESSFKIDYGEDALSLFWRAGEYFKAWKNIEHVSVLRRSLGLSIENLEKEAGRKSPIRLSLRAKDVFIPDRLKEAESLE